MNLVSEYLFVYGTLMEGFSNPFAAKFHKVSTFIGKGSFSGSIYQIGWYPGAIYDKNSVTQVQGEIYEIYPQSEILKDLDEYEDVFEDESLSMYVRRKIPVNREDQVAFTCWSYLYNRSTEDLKLIESGDFRSILNDI